MFFQEKHAAWKLVKKGFLLYAKFHSYYDFESSTTEKNEELYHIPHVLEKYKYKVNRWKQQPIYRCWAIQGWKYSGKKHWIADSK